jgi:signal transduction histidine kinase
MWAASLPKMLPYSTYNCLSIEMLPETIEDLLNVAQIGEGETERLSSAVEMLQFAAPCLVLLACANGTVVFADDFGSGAAPELTANLACDLARRLEESDSKTVAVKPPFEGRLRLALSLPRTAKAGMLACLVESTSLFGETLDDASTAAILCSALASAAVRYKTRNSELSARIEQLMAGQDALRASYAKSLAEAIEEHELHLREQEAAHAQLVQAQKLESIGQLAAGIAHEINTPTQFIGDNLRFLEDAFGELAPVLVQRQRSCAGAGVSGPANTPLPRTATATSKDDLEYLIEEIPKAIAQSLEGVGRVANIVRSMKEFSHPGTDELQPVDLNKALECTLTVCRNEWKYVADVVTDLDPSLPLVPCMPGACNQVFLNLIINAAHAIADKQGSNSTTKGTITVSTRVDGDWVEVRVADTGTGIAEKHRTKVFDPFFTTKKVGRGTGQGLAIARSVIVDKHGGTLSFETEVGRGTAFIVRLPQRPAGLCPKGPDDA